MKRIVCIALILSLILCGCDFGSRRYGAAHSEYIDIVKLVQTAVPHLGYTNPNLDGVKLLETDSYGRRLFQYSLNEVGARALVICQKTENPLTYYYEDDCYLTYLRRNGEPTQEEINQLKANNDWDQPLVESRMRSVDYSSSLADIQKGANNMEVHEKIESAINRTSSEYYVTPNGLETDAQNNQVILAEVYHYGEDTKEFFILLYSHEEAKVITWEAIESGADLRESIIAFKEANGLKK